MAMQIDCTVTFAAVWHNGRPTQQWRYVRPAHHAPSWQTLRSHTHVHTAAQSDPLQEDTPLGKVPRS